MQKLGFVVDELSSGKRLDIFLTSHLLQSLSRSSISTLIKSGNVLVNGLGAKGHHKVKVGEEVTIEIPEPEKPAGLLSQDIPLKIIYEDDDVVVVDKPAGLAVHPGAGRSSGTLVNALLFRLKRLASLGGELRPGVVHRLDKDTSGVMVVAKTDRAYLNLAKQFKSHTIKRKYIAFVKGVVEFDEGIVDAPIGRHPTRRKDMAVEFVKGRPAVTRYKVIKRFKDMTQLEITPQTGRTHQIRVHMSHLGHPLIGDRQYGGPAKLPRQALHAAYLGFTHPATGEPVEFQSPLPEDMRLLQT